MKFRLSGLFLFLFVGIALIATGQSTHALETVEPEVIERIRHRCVENQAALNRLHQTDAFLRTDRGNLYRTISDKLMVPLNRRVAGSQLDGAKLVTITADYNNEYKDFYDAYIKYDNALSEVLKIDCTKEPVTFYDALLEAREKRSELSKINTQIKQLIKNYAETFGEFKKQYKKDNS